MPMDQNCPLRCTEEGLRGATGWRSPPDPTDKQTSDKGQVVTPAQPLEQVSRSSMHERPPAK